MRDGVVLPHEPLTAVFASGRWNRVPVIMGRNRDEYKTFSADKPEYTRLLLGKLPLLRDRRAYQAEMKCLSLAWKALHVDALADAMLAGGHADGIHARLFAWNPLFAGNGDMAEYERWCREFGCNVSAEEFRPRIEV